MSDLIRPLATRVDDARMTLAASPFPLDPLLVGEFKRDPGPPPRIPVEVREEVIRQALDDALAYHTTGCCPHVAECECEPTAVLAAARIVCPVCTHIPGIQEAPEPFDWSFEGCVLCGAQSDPILAVGARTGGMNYVAHVCSTCASWWPRPVPEPEPPPHAQVNTIRSEIRR